MNTKIFFLLEVLLITNKYEKQTVPKIIQINSEILERKIYNAAIFFKHN